MKKKTFAIKGKLRCCLVPLLLLFCALYLYFRMASPVFSGNGTVNKSVFDIISDFAEGL